MNELFKKLIPAQVPDSPGEFLIALREVMQSLTLLGLWRAKLFNHAAFYGGTALRILYGLNRFSEDLDFSLLSPKTGFSFKQYKSALENEFNAIGLQVKLESRKKKVPTAIESAFLKANTWQQLLVIEAPETILSQVNQKAILKIKLEIDTNPPSGFDTELKYVFSPLQFAVRSYTLPSLFAGKMHAVLCRKWKNRVKGRDWYDFAWYASYYPELNLQHLEQRMRDTGHFTGQASLTRLQLLDLLNESIENLDVVSARNEVMPFLRDPRETETWSKDFFRAACNRIIVV